MSDDLVKRLRFGVAIDEQGDVSWCSQEVMFNAASRIEKLERDVLKYSSAVADAQMRNEELDRAINRIIDRWEAQKARIEKLEAALLWYAEHCQKGGDDIEGPYGDYGQRARKALEGEDD